jgi:hypothetical protein
VKTIPKTTQTPYARPPPANAAIPFMNALVEKATSTGSEVSLTASLPAAASESVEVAAACTSNAPARAAAATAALRPRLRRPPTRLAATATETTKRVGKPRAPRPREARPWPQWKIEPLPRTKFGVPAFRVPSRRAPRSSRCSIRTQPRVPRAQGQARVQRHARRHSLPPAAP